MRSIPTRRAAFAFVLSCALAPAAFAQEATVAEQTVDVMNRLGAAPRLPRQPRQRTS